MLLPACSSVFHLLLMIIAAKFGIAWYCCSFVVTGVIMSRIVSKFPTSTATLETCLTVFQSYNI